MIAELSSDSHRGGVFEMLNCEVIQAGLCTHCGTCVGLSPNTLDFQTSDRGPLPELISKPSQDLSVLAYDACPGKGLDYPALNKALFQSHPENWLAGCFRKSFIGYSINPNIRKNGASAGIITQTLLYLLEEGHIDGAVVLRHGSPKPWLSEPFIASMPDDIIASSQSVYVPTPVNTILSQMAEFKGRLAFVGLPDQVASLRYLQSKGHPGALRVNYVLGPYVGTMMYLDAIQSFLRSNGYFVLDEIESLRYRQGEWPGYLSVKMRSGHELRADKFYYNYLIPFYITDSTLMSVDFTNELTDISVGDAWNPDYESQGAGFSVVLARTEKALEVLNDMGTKNLVSLDEIEIQDALSMHGHMLDFKKRGTFIRMNWRKERGKPVPDYGYLPFKIPLSRILVEVVISAIFLVCRTKVARKVVEWFPISIIGPFFNNLRISWKAISKPTKRKGLDMTDYMLVRRD